MLVSYYWDEKVEGESQETCSARTHLKKVLRHLSHYRPPRITE